MRSLAHRAEIIQQSSRNREEREVGSARVCPPPGLGPERCTPSCPHKPATAKAIPVGCWKFRSCDRETRRTPQSSTSKRESFLGIWGTSRGICGFFPPKSQLAAQTGLPLQRSSDGSSSLGKTRALFYPRKCKKTFVLLGRRRGRLTVTKMPATHVSSSAHSPGSLASPPSCSFSLHRSHGLPGVGGGLHVLTRLGAGVLTTPQVLSLSDSPVPLRTGNGLSTDSVPSAQSSPVSWARLSRHKDTTHWAQSDPSLQGCPSLTRKGKALGRHRAGRGASAAAEDPNPPKTLKNMRPSQCHDHWRGGSVERKRGRL